MPLCVVSCILPNSRRVDENADSSMSGERAPYHAHIYYDLADRGAAERLHRELSKSKGCGDLTGVLYVGEMRDKSVGPHPKPQFEVHFLKNALPAVMKMLRPSGLTAPSILSPTMTSLITPRWHYGPASRLCSIIRSSIRRE